MNATNAAMNAPALPTGPLATPAPHVHHLHRATPTLAFLQRIAVVCVSLWLGSLAHTMLSVWSLFQQYPKALSDVAVKGAPVIFNVTERANLALALITVTTLVAWVFASPSRTLKWLLVLVTLALAMAIVQTTLISAKMNALREAGESGGAMFKQLHGYSSSQYVVQTLILLAVAVILPTALKFVPGKASTTHRA